MDTGGKDTAMMSKAELALHSDNDPALMNWKAKKGKGGKVLTSLKCCVTPNAFVRSLTSLLCTELNVTLCDAG